MTSDGRSAECSLPLKHMEIALSDEAGPMELFLAEHLHPRLSDPYLPQNVWADWQLLVIAAKRQRIRSHRINEATRVFGRGDHVIGGMTGASTSLVSAMAEEILGRRSLIGKCLQEAGVPCVSADHYGVAEQEMALQAFRASGAPAAIMPDFTCQGRGLSTGITSEQEFLAGWKAALWADEKFGPDADGGDPQRVRVQNEQRGLAVSAYVVGENVVAAAVLVPLYIVGDGHSTVSELIEDMQGRRGEHALLKKYPVSVSAAQLAARGLEKSSVLAHGQLTFLRQRASLATGAVPVDVTEALSAQQRDLAVSALWSVPGLPAGQVELIVPSVSEAHQDSEPGAVLAVDGRAGFRMHHYPVIGRPRNVAEALVQAMRDQDRD